MLLSACLEVLSAGLGGLECQLSETQEKSNFLGKALRAVP